MTVSSIVDRIRGSLQKVQFDVVRSVPLITDAIKAAMPNDIIPVLNDIGGFMYLEQLYRRMGLTLSESENEKIKYINLSDIRSAIDDYETDTMELHVDSIVVWVVDTLYDTYGGGGFVADAGAPGGEPPSSTYNPPFENRKLVKLRNNLSSFTHDFYSSGYYPEIVDGSINGERIEIHDDESTYDYALVEFVLIPDYSDITTATDLTDVSVEIINGLLVPAACGRLARADGGRVNSASFRAEYNSKVNKLRARAKQRQSVLDVKPIYQDRGFYKLDD